MILCGVGEKSRIGHGAAQQHVVMGRLPFRDRNSQDARERVCCFRKPEVGVFDRERLAGRPAQGQALSADSFIQRLWGGAFGGRWGKKLQTVWEILCLQIPGQDSRPYLRRCGRLALPAQNTAARDDCNAGQSNEGSDLCRENVGHIQLPCSSPDRGAEGPALPHPDSLPPNHGDQQYQQWFPALPSRAFLRLVLGSPASNAIRLPRRPSVHQAPCRD